MRLHHYFLPLEPLCQLFIYLWGWWHHLHGEHLPLGPQASGQPPPSHPDTWAHGPELGCCGHSLLWCRHLSQRQVTSRGGALPLVLLYALPFLLLLFILPHWLHHGCPYGMPHCMQPQHCLPPKSCPALVQGQQGHSTVVFIECTHYALPRHDLPHIPVPTLTSTVRRFLAYHTIQAWLKVGGIQMGEH